MISLGEAKKGRGLDDVLKDIIPGTVEEFKNPVGGSQRYSHLFHFYERMLDYDLSNIKRCYLNEKIKTIDEHVGEIAEQIPDIFPPLEINALLQATLPYEGRLFYSLVTGMFITRLLQSSFDAGYNDFILDTTVLPEIHDIAKKLCGTPEKRLNLKVIGNVGSFGNSARYCSVLSNGNADFYGFGALDCRFELHGRVIAAAQDCTNSEFIFYDAMGKPVNINRGIHRTQDSTFKTTVRENIPILRETIPKNRGNKIYFINEQGEEEVVRNFDDGNYHKKY